MRTRFIMRSTHMLIVLCALSLTSGCVFNSADVAVRRLNHEAVASGSPYRWRYHSVPVSGAEFGRGFVFEKYRIIPPSPSPIPADLHPTTANTELRTDILAKIDFMQRDWGCKVAPTLLGVQPLGFSDGSFREAWFIKQGDGAIRYEVTITPSPQGGTDFKIDES
jgi:hypothetical protein